LWEHCQLLHKKFSSSEMGTRGELIFSCSNHDYSWSRRWDWLWTKKEISDLIGTHRDVLAPDIRINSQGHRVAI
jgi:hypothetical protein